MTPRPRKHALPDNLTYDQPSGRFRYRNPEALRPEHYRQVAAELTLAAVPEL